MMVLRGRIQSIKDNPIIIREWRSRTHRRLIILFFFLYLFILAGATAAILLLISLQYSVWTGRLFWNDIGSAAFWLTTLLEGMLLLFTVPALTASTISGEKQRQTYDILRTTTLSARRLVSGKLLSALRYPMILVALSTVFQLLAAFTEYIYLADVLVVQMMMITTATAAALLGLLCSAFFKSTPGATISTYALLCCVLVGIPILVAIGSNIEEQWRFSFSRPSDRLSVATLAHVNHLVGSTNLPYAVIQSAMIRANGDSYFGEEQYLWVAGGGFHVWFPSPWYLYLFWQGVLSLGFYKLAVWQVGCISD